MKRDSYDGVWDDRTAEAFFRERDGVAALHDIEAEAGDEESLADAFVVDERAARELGLDLDRTSPSEPVLD